MLGRILLCDLPTVLQPARLRYKPRWRVTAFSTAGLGHRRFSSTAALLVDEHGHELQQAESSRSATQRHVESLSAAQQLAYRRLRPVIDSFEAPIDWAVAYGSGVVHQANESSTLVRGSPIVGDSRSISAHRQPPPLTDFIMSTPSAAAFHIANLKQNPRHYPLYARVIGGRAVGWIQERLGAGMWYVTNVRVRDLEVKYGVISTATLMDDLSSWSTLYVSGRLHKPVLPLVTMPDLEPHLQTNLRSALTLSLILLPPRFTELALWEQIAGISYLGDPRMSVPGAENPEKVRNIVRGEGVVDGFRRMYGGILGDAGVSEEKQDDGQIIMLQPDTTEHIANLLSALPLKLRSAIARHFRPTVVGSLVSSEVRAERAAAPSRGQEDLEFWVRIAQQDRFREVVTNGQRAELTHIVRRPALVQSIKGLFTAGLVKSVAYSMAKFRKWLRGRRKAAQAKAKLVASKLEGKDGR